MSYQSNNADKLRSERVEVRLTVQEAHLLVTKAVSARMTVSEFIRKSALAENNGSLQDHLDRRALIEEIEVLNKIGMTLSHIARTNTVKGVQENNALLSEALHSIKNVSGQIVKKIAV